MADDRLGMRLTNAGAALLARTLAGEQLTFTRGAFGDSFQNGQLVQPDTAQQAECENLINERLSLPLIKITPTGAYAEVDMQVQNAQVDNSFMISEIGLFAKIGDEQEKLYGYFNAGLNGDYMPAARSAIAKDYVYTVIIAIGNAENVTAIINKSDYELPTASPEVKGGVKVGSGLFMSGDSLNASAQNYSLPTASTYVKGGVKVDSGTYGLVIEDDTLKIDAASWDYIGGVKVQSGSHGLKMEDDILKMEVASSDYIGGVKVTGNDGLVMDGDTLKCTIEGGDGGGSGLTNPLNEDFTLQAASSGRGRAIFMEGDEVGGRIYMGATGGQTSRNASAGYIDMSAPYGYGGCIDMHGSLDGTLGTSEAIIYMYSYNGGIIYMEGRQGSGGTIIAGGYRDGGSIDASGTNGKGGILDLHGKTSGGVISLGGDGGGSIKGDVYFHNNVSLNSNLFSQNGDISLSSDKIFIYKGDNNSSQVSVDGSQVYLNDSSVRVYNANETIYSGNIRLGGSSAAYLTIDAKGSKLNLTDASIKADSATVTSANNAPVHVNARTSFENTVSIVSGLRVVDSLQTYFGKSSDIVIESDSTLTADNLTVKARYDSISVTYSTIKANGTLFQTDANTSITGHGHFVDYPIFDAGLISSKQITLQSDDGAMGRSIDMSGEVKGGSINMSGADSSSGGSIRGNVHFTDKVIFENGAEGIGGSDYTLPTASSSTKGGVKIGTGLSMNGETLNCTVTGGLTNPVNGTLSVLSGSSGGSINASGQIYGGTVNLYGAQDGGTISLAGGQNGGKLYMGGQYPGHIYGKPVFDNGLVVGTGHPSSQVISDIQIKNGNLVITIDGTAYTFTPNVSAGLPLSTVASSTNGMVWLGDSY